MSRVFAIDVGASSYRVVQGIFQQGKIQMTELARFKHTPLYEENHYYWDIDQMKQNMIETIREAALEGEPVLSIGFDTFGTDFALISDEEKMIRKPLAYRDHISDGMYETYFSEEEQFYEKIGGTYRFASTAHILAGIKKNQFIDFDKTAKILLMPDLLTWIFTGISVNEFTIATTTRLLNIKEKKWNFDLIDAIGVPRNIFQSTVEPEHIVGSLKKEITANIPNLKGTVVVTTACHDTASAVATIPYVKNSSFISSGSWSVKGILTKKPFTSKEAFNYQMANEGSAYGAYRLIRNITGLWLLEECVRSWRSNGLEISIPMLSQKALQTEAFPSMLYTDAKLFENAGNMTKKIQEYCERTKQKIPNTPKEYMKTIIKGLACEYRKHNEELREVTGQQVQTIFIVGGGRYNAYLNQCTADITGCTVVCGHPEATALGNMLIQLKAHHIIVSEKEFADIAASDVKPIIYKPLDTQQCEKIYQRYLTLREQHI